MAEEKEEAIGKDKQPIKPAHSVGDELSDRDIEKVAGGANADISSFAHVSGDPCH